MIASRPVESRYQKNNCTETHMSGVKGQGRRRSHGGPDGPSVETGLLLLVGGLQTIAIRGDVKGATGQDAWHTCNCGGDLMNERVSRDPDRQRGRVSPGEAAFTAY